MKTEQHKEQIIYNLEPFDLTPEANHFYKEKQGFAHICVNCGKAPYLYGNSGLCYKCVKEENKKEIPKLRQNPVKLILGHGELAFIIEELIFLRGQHQESYYYKDRIDLVLNTLRKYKK